MQINLRWLALSLLLCFAISHNAYGFQFFKGLNPFAKKQNPFSSSQTSQNPHSQVSFGSPFRQPTGSPDKQQSTGGQLPSRQALIQTFNARAAAAKQLNSSVTVKVPGAPKIKGSLQIEFPNRMRLKAGVLGVSEMGVDAGSNDQRFWVWSKMDLPGQPAAMYYANHEEFQNSSLKKQIPLEPQWLIDAIGLVPLDATGQHHGPFAEGNRWKLITVFNQNGRRQTRVILINSTTGVVEQTSMYDENNQLIAYANATNFKNYQQYGLSLPHRVELHVIQPGQKDYVMKVDLGSYSINSLFGDPAQMWAMPRPQNVKAYDLGAQPRR